ncbi:MAG TPA: MerR family DNA-binding transcriptional regulator, partial [Streptosporangiaceae bacterium]
MDSAHAAVCWRVRLRRSWGWCEVFASPAGGGCRLAAVDDDGLLLSIGELARRSGLPVRTIRFWSDAGVLPPAERTDGG